MSDYKLDLVDKSLRAFCFPLIENQRKTIGTAWVQVANAISSFGIIYQKKGVAHVPIPPIGYYLNLIKSKKQPLGNIKPLSSPGSKQNHP